MIHIIKRLMPTKSRRKPTQQRTAHYRANKEKARLIIEGRVDYYADKYGFSYNRVLIKNTQTRWGSCSSKRNLNFNYRIAFLESDVMDYVVIHELCHLRHMNHSKEYWREVRSIMPDYREHKNSLRKISLQK